MGRYGRAGGVIAGLCALVVLSGCRAGHPIGGEAWLDYDGAHPEIVDECVEAVPTVIRVPTGGFPGAAEFGGVTVRSDDLDAVRSRFHVEGRVVLKFTGASDLEYAWSCDLSQRLTMLTIIDLDAELVDAS